MSHGVSIGLVVILVLFGMYRRVRRTIGFQKFRKKSMIVRISIFAILGIILLASGYLNPKVYIFDAIGIVIGAVIAYFAVKTTSFEWRKNAWYYRPNPWIGVLLVVLFIGRIAYRMYQDYALFSGGGSSAAEAANQNPWATYSHDPSTTLILFTLITYYFVYYTFVISRERHLEAMGPNNGVMGIE